VLGIIVMFYGASVLKALKPVLSNRSSPSLNEQTAPELSERPSPDGTLSQPKSTSVPAPN
ncbi:MAG: hypothetical protein AAFU78_20845, partial [Cyanobacteria bacterium J06633_2]